MDSTPTTTPTTSSPPDTDSTRAQMAALFTAQPPGTPGWIRVQPQLASYWRTQLGVYSLLVALGVAALWLLLSQKMSVNIVTIAGALALVILGVVAVWIYLIIGRRVASIGYRLMDNELHISSGILFQKLVVVPRSRLQLVEVTTGPIERMFGIASIQLHTASASTQARIPGLNPHSAGELKESLAGDSAGL